MIRVLMRKKFIDLISKDPRVCYNFCYGLSTSAKKQPVESPAKFELLLQKHHFSPKTVSQVASALANVKNSGNPELILSFLKESGISNSQLEKIVIAQPQILASGLEDNIKPKIRILQGLGYSENELAQWITKSPWILRRSTPSIVRSVSVLKGLVGSDAELPKLLSASCWFLSNDLEKTLLPNVEFLKSCGVPLKSNVKLMYLYPRPLLRDPETIRRSVDKADEMGVSRSSKMFIIAVCVLSSMSNKTWEMKIQAFRDMGFSEDDILKVFRQSPPVFAISVEKMMKVKEVLLATGKYDISCIVNAPTSLCRSIERRYKPRLQVLGILEAKKLSTNWPSLSTLSIMKDKKFFDKYVAPYLDEVGDVYKSQIAVAGKRQTKRESSNWATSQEEFKNKKSTVRDREGCVFEMVYDFARG